MKLGITIKLTIPVVDWSALVLDPVDLLNNYDSRGGQKTVKSNEREIQKQRELTSLMVFYNSAADIPSNPKEPADPYSGQPSEERLFGEPTDDTKVHISIFPPLSCFPVLILL